MFPNIKMGTTGMVIQTVDISQEALKFRIFIELFSNISFLIINVV